MKAALLQARRCEVALSKSMSMVPSIVEQSKRKLRLNVNSHIRNLHTLLMRYKTSCESQLEEGYDFISNKGSALKTKLETLAYKIAKQHEVLQDTARDEVWWANNLEKVESIQKSFSEFDLSEHFEELGLGIKDGFVGQLEQGME